MRVEEVLNQLDGYSKGFGGYNARCPAHDDHRESLSISVGDDGRVLLQCFAGCTIEQITAGMGIHVRHLHPGVELEPTVEELAADKGLDATFLRSLGLHDLPDWGGVGIPVYDRNGQDPVIRRRTALSAKGGTFQPSGVRLRAYGLWRHAWIAQNRWALVVEGESDCWTAWQHGFPAIGVPGANSAGNTIDAEVLQDVDRIWVVQEPDAGGAAFVKGVTQAIERANWRGQAYVVRFDGAKDVNDLLKQTGVGFTAALQAALAQATPIDAPPSIASSEVEWPDPTPVGGDALSVPRFMSDELLPQSLHPWQDDISQRTGSPPEYAAIGALVALGTVVGRRLAVRPKERDDWQKIPNLWGAAVGAPGTLKTPALVAALAPLKALDDELRSAQVGLSKSQEFDQMVAKARRDELTLKIRENLKGHRDPSTLRTEMESITDPISLVRQYIVNDATAEKLADVLVANPNGVLVYRDELNGFFAMQRREERAGERQLFLEAWNGDGPYSIARIKRGYVHVPGLCVSMLGTIQPGPLRSEIEAAMRGGAGDDGLVQRFQLLVEPDLHGTPVSVDKWPDTGARAMAFGLYRRLAECEASQLGAQVEEGKGAFMRFSQRGQQVFNGWYAELERRLASSSEAPVLIGHLSKYRSLMPTIALLLHLADVAAGLVDPGPVTESAAETGIAWCDLLEAHARRIYGSVRKASSPGALLREHILAGEVESPFNGRLMVRHHWSGLRTTSSFKLATDELLSANWVRAEEVGSGGQKTALFHINPKVFTP